MQIEDNAWIYIYYQYSYKSYMKLYQFLLPSLWINSLSLSIWFGNYGKDGLFFWQKYTFFLKEAGNLKGESFVSDVSDKRDSKKPDFRVWGGAIHKAFHIPFAFPLVSCICNWLEHR